MLWWPAGMLYYPPAENTDLSDLTAAGQSKKPGRPRKAEELADGVRPNKKEKVSQLNKTWLKRLKLRRDRSPFVLHGLCSGLYGMKYLAMVYKDQTALGLLVGPDWLQRAKSSTSFVRLLIAAWSGGLSTCPLL